MSKKEPLQGKLWVRNLDINNSYAFEKDIKSAVDWLKHKVEEGTLNLGKRYDLDCDEVLELIDKAFEDVTR